MKKSGKRIVHPIDYIFFNLEKERQPIHLAGLLVFDLPQDAASDFVENIAQGFLTGDFPIVAPFNEQLEGLFWKETKNINIHQHFKHIKLVEPNNHLNDVTALISQWHAEKLPKDRPMWRCYLIEGLAKNQFAIYLQVHHSKVDGIAGTRLIHRALAKNKDDKNIVPLWSSSHLQQPSKNKDKLKLSWSQTIKNILKSSYKIGREIIYNIKHRHRTEGHVATFDAPTTLFNKKISGKRKYVAQSYDIRRLRRIADHFQVTVNDVILALCSSSLRNYLLKHGQLPKKPLVSFVPASMRNDDQAVGNRITVILASLATHIDDPVARLKEIQKTMDYSKRRFSNMTKNEVLLYSALVCALPGLQVLSGKFLNHQSFNVVISSLITAKETLYLNGAKLSALYPTSVLFDGQALNMTMGTYLDQIDIGLLVCAEAIPDVEDLLVGIEQSLLEYEAYVG